MEELIVTLVTFDGAVNWTVGFLTTVSIFAILALALNVQWSVGILNFGVAAFFMVGAYVSAVLTLPAPEGLESYVAGWGLPIPVGWRLRRLPERYSRSCWESRRCGCATTSSRLRRSAWRRSCAASPTRSRVWSTARAD